MQFGFRGSSPWGWVWVLCAFFCLGMEQGNPKADWVSSLPSSLVDSSVQPLQRVIPLPTVPVSSVPRSNAPVVHADPLDSPFPLPWQWVETSLTMISQSGRSGLRTYTSPKVLSPDGEYLAFCQIQVQGQPQYADSQISSTLIIQNRKTGQHQSISLAPNYTRYPERPSDLTGTIAILWPVGWSQSGDRLLVRNFSGLLGADIVSDSALVWYRQNQSTASFNPLPINYDTAILLGWSTKDPKQILFRTHTMGETEEPMLAVNERNQTMTALGDRPLIYGERLSEDKLSP